MNEKDLATAEAIIKEASSWGFIFTHNKEDEVREMIYAALTTARKEARGAAFTEIGVELQRYGPNIRKVDLMTRFQELFRESEAAASTEEGGGDG